MNHIKMKNGENHKQSTRIKGLKLRIGQGGGRKVHYKIRLKRSHKHSHISSSRVFLPLRVWDLEKAPVRRF